MNAPHIGLLEQLKSAADGLVYSSEGDHPFEVVELADDASSLPLTEARLRKILALPETTRVREVTLERVLGRHTVFTDPSDVDTQRIRPRYEALQALLETRLHDTRAFRLGAPPVIDVWMLGRVADGRLMGYRTVAIET